MDDHAEQSIGGEREEMRKILRRIFGGKEPLKDEMSFRDSIKVTMRREDGSIYKEWEEEGNTWVAFGKTKVRDALANGGFTKIGYMYCYATTGSSEQTTTNSTPASDLARFVATWPAAGAITGITKFSIRQTTGGSDCAEISVTSFDKPDGISLEVTWDTTVS